MDRLARGHTEDMTVHPELDIAFRLEMHFDPRLLVIPTREMAKGVHGNRPSQFPVDPM